MSYEIKYEDRANCIPTFLGENAKGGCTCKRHVCLPNYSNVIFPNSGLMQ